MTSHRKIVATLRILSAQFGSHGGSLEIGTPYHMLVLVILSARTRDEQVLRLAPLFFKSFPTVERLAKADLAAITSRVNTVGMYKQKAKNLQAMARKIVRDFHGKIPSTMEELVSLAGVGRKTASVLLAAIFDTPAIAVDTHVLRVTKRLEWAKGETAAKVEWELRAAVPKKYWRDINHVFVPFGRAICTPKPRCFMCPIQHLCAYEKKNLEVPKNVSAIAAFNAKRHAEFVRLKKAAAQSL